MTADKQIPPWGQDDLSRLFQTAEYNNRVTSLKFPDVFRLLQQIDASFRHLTEAIERDSRQELLVPRLLIARTHSSFLASIRLSMSGQVPEATAVLRAGIEQAWYALHIAKDPRPPERVTVWLQRNDDESSRARCKKEFTKWNVHSTHLELDSVTAKQLGELYESMIDLGAHPNPLGVLTAIKMSDEEEETTCQVGLIAPKPIPVLHALKTTVEVMIGMFKVYELIFPERFKIMGLDEEIQNIIRELNRTFKRYAYD
jgi:hypothetical protein